MKVKHIISHQKMECDSKNYRWCAKVSTRKDWHKSSTLLFICQRAGYKTVQVRTPDSDILFILLHYIRRLEGVDVMFYTRSGNYRKLINILTEVGRAYADECRSALLVLHAFCGCDSVSAFKGRCHVLQIKTLEKNVKVIAYLCTL